MTIADTVIDYLKKQGFRPEFNTEAGVITFKFEMEDFYFTVDDNDEQFFQLSLPIYSVNERNRRILLEIANMTNHNFKIVKCCVTDEMVFLYFESRLDSTPVLDDIFPWAIGSLKAAREKFLALVD